MHSCCGLWTRCVWLFFVFYLFLCSFFFCTYDCYLMISALCKEAEEEVTLLRVPLTFLCCPPFAIFIHHLPTMCFWMLKPAFYYFQLFSVCIWILASYLTCDIVALHQRQHRFFSIWSPHLSPGSFLNAVWKTGWKYDKFQISVELCITLHSVIHLINKRSWSDHTEIWILQ